jgi:hypothetical protein
MTLLRLTVALFILAGSPAVTTADEATATFAAPLDRVWAVTGSVLKSLGWEIEKSDRTIGWITTESQRVEGEDSGVYAKGTRHRLPITMKETGGRTAVAVDKDEPLATTDRSVERELLTALGLAL